MIPRPLVEPLPLPRSARPPRKVALLVGGLLLLSAVLGALLWVQLTPFGFGRFSLADGDLVENISQPGTFYVFEERRGSSQPALPPPIKIGVTSEHGDVITVEPLVQPSIAANPLPYATPWHEGRAIAKFTVDQPGLYHVRTVPVRRGAIAGYGPRYGGMIAVGAEVSTTWLATWWGLLLLAGAPLVAGIVVLVVGQRRERRRRSGVTTTTVTASRHQSAVLAVSGSSASS